MHIPMYYDIPEKVVLICIKKTWWKIQTGRFFRIVDQMYQGKNFDGDFVLNSQEFWQVLGVFGGSY